MPSSQALPYVDAIRIIVQKSATRSSAGYLYFDPSATIYDDARHQPNICDYLGHSGAGPGELLDDDGYVRDVDRLAEVVGDHTALVQSAWAQTTRKSYHRWTLVYERFANMCDSKPLPVSANVLIMWMHTLALSLSGGTVNQAVSAVVSWCALNNLKNPVDENPAVRKAWRALRRTRFQRTRIQKFPLDPGFLLQCWGVFKTQWLGTDDLVRHRSMAFMLVGVEGATRVRELRCATLCNWYDLDGDSSLLQLLCTKNNMVGALCFSRVAIAVSKVPLWRAPTAARFMREVYMPLLQKLGISKHPYCRQQQQSMSPCLYCPRLFPTLNGRTGYDGTMSAQHVTDELRSWLRRTGHSEAQARCFSGASFRRTGASWAAIRKAHKLAIQHHLRHAPSVTDSYIELRDRDRLCVSRAIQSAVVAQVGQPEKSFNNNECAICAEPGRLLLCDGCVVAVHPSCVGLVAMPAKEEPWYCWKCDPRDVVVE